MFQRLLLNLLFFFVFALVQIGALTHGISHVNELTQQSDHSNPDKNTATDQCGQCIGSAQVAAGLPNQAFLIHLNQAQYQLTTPYVAYLASVLIASYSARAPPKALNN